MMFAAVTIFKDLGFKRTFRIDSEVGLYQVQKKIAQGINAGKSGNYSLLLMIIDFLGDFVARKINFL